MLLTMMMIMLTDKAPTEPTETITETDAAKALPQTGDGGKISTVLYSNQTEV